MCVLMWRTQKNCPFVQCTKLQHTPTNAYAPGGGARTPRGPRRRTAAPDWPGGNCFGDAKKRRILWSERRSRGSNSLQETIKRPSAPRPSSSGRWITVTRGDASRLSARGSALFDAASPAARVLHSCRRRGQQQRRFSSCQSCRDRRGVRQVSPPPLLILSSPPTH